MSDSSIGARTEFLKRLDRSIADHKWKKSFDAAMHQSLVIGSAIAGFAALSLGLLAKGNPEYSIWAGAIGALTSVATILSQQLHCVRAINWHERMAVELENMRDQFLFTYKSEPTDDQLAAMIEELSKLRLKMADAWEKITASGPTALGRIKKPQKLGI